MGVLEAGDTRSRERNATVDDEAKAKHDSPARERSISGTGDDAA